MENINRLHLTKVEHSYIYCRVCKKRLYKGDDCAMAKVVGYAKSIVTFAMCLEHLTKDAQDLIVGIDVARKLTNE